MIIDKTLKAAAYFTAEANIRPTLKWVFLKKGKLYATDSFRACSFKFELKWRPELKHSEYPEIWLKEVDLSEEFSLDWTFLKKLKFKANKSMAEVLQNTALMWEMQKDFIHFWQTDLNNTNISWTRKLPWWECPDIDSFIYWAKLKTEVKLNIDYLIDTLQAFKEKGATQINIWVWKVSGNNTAKQPVVFSDSDNAQDIAIIMPLLWKMVFWKQMWK